jgi:hypothetical protein
MLSKFLGRSTSYIHNTLNSISTKLFLTKNDYRKLADSTRKLTSASRWRNFQKYMVLWEAFILGETEKPP